MNRILSFLSDESATATVEFVMLFPAYITVLLASVESSTLMLRNVWLERGLDMAVRDLRLRLPGHPTDENELILATCNYSSFIRNCDKVLRLELNRVNQGNWALPTGSIACRSIDDWDASGNPPANEPSNDFDTSQNHDIMVVRACLRVKPFFPSSAFYWGLNQPEGEYNVSAASAFVVEPN